MLINLLLLTIFVYAICFFVNDKIKDRKEIILAEAGDKTNITNETSKVTFRDVGFSLHGYIPFKVHNNCMNHIGVNANDILLARKLQNLSKNNLAKLIKFGDVLLLKINDNGVIKHKIRMVDKITANNEIVTFYFDKKDDIVFKHKSSENHRIEHVLGIVEYEKAS